MSGYFYREEQRGVSDTRELPLPHSAAAEEMFAAIDAVFGSVQTRDCLATSTFDDGIDMPFSDQPAVGGKGYMPPFCAYKSGVVQKRKLYNALFYSHNWLNFTLKSREKDIFNRC